MRWGYFYYITFLLFALNPEYHNFSFYHEIFPWGAILGQAILLSVYQ